MRLFRIIALMPLFIASAIQISAQNNRTFYFERVAVVQNGTKQSASGDGHYLTVNSKILYESDANGLSMGTSSVKYMNSENNRPLYEGKTALGDHLAYVFNSDFSRLNIKKLDGTVYVYERKSQPSPSKMRVYDKDDFTPVVVKDDNTSAQGGSSAHTRNTQTRQQRQQVTCSRCNGTRYIDKYVPSVSEYGVKQPEYYDCHICGKRVAKNGGHGHATCPSCHGTGYVYK